MIGATAVAASSTASAGDQPGEGFWPTDYKAFSGPLEFVRGDRDHSVRFAGDQQGISLTLRNNATEGTWTSRWHEPGGRFEWMVPSWRADTPEGTWVEVELQVQTDTNTSIWFSVGEWAHDDSTITRHTINGQYDDIGRIWTDTFAAYDYPPGGMPTSYRLRATMHGDGDAAPKLRQVAATTAMPGDLPEPGTASDPLLTGGKELDVPRLSQSIHSGEYPQFGGGGQVWCSPTSTTMVMDYWGVGPSEADLETLPPDPVFEDNDRKDPQVPWAAIHTWDYTYEGAGNWAFNTAYASHYGLDGSVRHYSSLRGLERWIDRGVPSVVSINWDNTDDDPTNDLDGSHISGTNGHLMVVIGFTEDGDVIANDPASPDNEQVRRVYKRDQFERNWLRASTGTSYIIKPAWKLG